MTFVWPQLLWALLAAPLLIWLYLWRLRRKRQRALRYASLTMMKDSLRASDSIKRHVPPLLFLLAIVAMIVASARPAALVTLPSQHETIVLALDVSGSMRATDVKPNRLAAARDAARRFIEEQPGSTRIAVVAFAAAALVVQHPTRDRSEIMAALNRLQPQRGTALGSAIVVSLATIFPNAGITLDAVEGEQGTRTRSHAFASNFPRHAAKETFKPVPSGSYPSAAIILLSDGQRTSGPDVIASARLAAERGVRIYTVGIGTPDGEVMAFEGWRMRVRLDEQTLKTVANITRGQYFHAGSAADLKNIYSALNSRFVLEKRQMEVTAFFAGIAAVLVMTSALLSLAWFNRIL